MFHWRTIQYKNNNNDLSYSLNSISFNIDCTSQAYLLLTEVSIFGNFNIWVVKNIKVDGSKMTVPIVHISRVIFMVSWQKYKINHKDYKEPIHIELFSLLI